MLLNGGASKHHGLMAEAEKRKIDKNFNDAGANFSRLNGKSNCVVFDILTLVHIFHVCSMFFYGDDDDDVVVPHRKGPWCGRRGNRACLHSVHHD